MAAAVYGAPGLRGVAGPYPQRESVLFIGTPSVTHLPPPLESPAAACETAVPDLVLDQQQRVHVIMGWAGSRVLTRGLAFAPSPACHGVGGFADSDIRAGDIILRLDRALMVTHQTCFKSLPPLERVQMPEFSSLVLWLVQQRLLKERSAWHGFVRTLPGPADIQSALFLDEDTVSNLPDEVRGACQRARARAAAALGFIAETVRDSPQVAELRDQLPRLFDRELGLWAAAVILSRGFNVKGRTLLLPFVDLVNSQRQGATCELEFDATGAPILRATSDIPRAQEVFIEYGVEKSDADLLANYGYSHNHQAL
jgi:hypothetical protein